MKPHRTGHWIAVGAAAALALLAFEAAGQADAELSYAGRPALAGAQAGLGALAGPPQGGIGLQGDDGAQLVLNPPAAVREQPAAGVARCDGPTLSAARYPACLPQVLDEGLERRLARLGLLDPEQGGRM